MENLETPTYYSVLPAEVRYDKRLKPSEKLLYAEITALTSKTGKCWATNKYFAELYDVDVLTVSRWVSNLRDCGYIEVELDKDGGNKRSIVLIKTSWGLDEKVKASIDEKVNYNNIKENNKKNSCCCVDKSAPSIGLFDRFVDWWNGELIPVEDNVNGNVVKIQVKSQKRKQIFKARWNDTKAYMRNRGMAVDDESVFVYMTDEVIGGNYVNSDWMRGKVKGNGYETGYRVEFDNIFTPKMWTGLLEKKYYNRSLDKVKYDS